jgi:DNA polymerase-3 subunit alpha
MRVESLASLDAAVAGVQRGLKIVLDRRHIEKNSGAVAAIKARLKPGGKGEIRLVLRLADRGKELELSVSGRYDVSPTVAGMLATIPGVVEVLEI